MRILMIGANLSAMKEDVLYMSAPSFVEAFYHSRNLAKFKDGSYVQIVSVKTILDMEKLRGLTYDFVITHASFPRNIEMHQLLQRYILR